MNKRKVWKILDGSYKPRKQEVDSEDVERLIAAVQQECYWDDRDVETWDAINSGKIEKTIHVDGMGEFEEGTIGALRFEIQGIVNGKKLLVMEHITRIDDDCAPDWPYPPTGQGSHQVQITGNHLFSY